MAETSIDLSYLKTISMGNKDFELKLLKTFLDQTAVEMEKIRASLQQKDLDSISAAAHKIKSSFHFLGALRTEELLNTIENIARYKKETEKLPGLVSSFLNACTKILEDVTLEIEKFSGSLK